MRWNGPRSKKTVVLLIDSCYLTAWYHGVPAFSLFFLSLSFLFISMLLLITWSHEHKTRGYILKIESHRARLVCSVLVNSDILTANYGIKQNQFTKPTSEHALVTLKNLMRPLTAQLEDGYCIITVANHRLIIVIGFVAKSYTYSWKRFCKLTSFTTSCIEDSLVEWNSAAWTETIVVQLPNCTYKLSFYYWSG